MAIVCARGTVVWRWRGAAVAALIAITVGGCGKSPSSPAPSPVPQPAFDVASIAIQSAPDFVLLGQSQQLTATLTFADGGTAIANKINWSVSPESVASITPHGLLSGRAAGAFTVTASLEGATTNRTARVVPDVSGRWTGTVNFVRCHGGWCGRHEPYRPGEGSMVLELHRAGASVTGSITLGDTAGNVNGEIGLDGTLTLDGIYDPADPGWFVSPLADRQRVIDVTGAMTGGFSVGWPDSYQIDVEFPGLRRQPS